MTDTRPRLPSPPGTCDTHMHIFEPGYSVMPGTNLPSMPGTIAEYRKLRERLGITRTVIVQPAAYGRDNRCTLAAMQALADDRHQTRGVAIVLPEDSDEHIAELTAAGIRGIRYHLLPYGGVSWDTLREMAARVAPHGWHVQIQCEGGELAGREALLKSLPCDIVIDHIGRFTQPVAAGDPGWKSLRSLIDGGRCWVKLSAPYHGSKTGAPDYADAAASAKELIRAAPERMLYATNWPHPSLKTNLPDDAALLDWVNDQAGSDALRQRILVDNPAKLYGF
ncbi:MAG: amidohydrolase family protein [Burkholderiales bacterium]|nr:amidohydrolase family protein [Burkholderiales bacterium]